MAAVTIRELRNHGGEVVDRVLAGEHLVVTRDGHPVAELRPVRRPPLDAARVLARWSHLPPIDAAAFRTDVDEILDADL